MIVSRIHTLAVITGLATAICCSAADKAQYGTAAEAKTMAEKAIAELKKNETSALAEFNKPAGMYRDRDLYVFCFNTMDGKFSAQVDPALIGIDIRQRNAPDGSSPGKMIFEKVAAEKEGVLFTISYDYPRPNTTNSVPKESYIEKVGSTACGVGYYK